jgi:anti-sigma B factor antagonist
MLEIAPENENAVQVLKLAGRLDSNTSPQLEKELIGRVNEGSAQLVVDFTSLDYISSAGLRVLLMAAKRSKQTSGKLALCCLKDHIREVFEISGFFGILTICPSRAEAVTAVG